MYAFKYSQLSGYHILKGRSKPSQNVEILIWYNRTSQAIQIHTFGPKNKGSFHKYLLGGGGKEREGKKGYLLTLGKKEVCGHFIYFQHSVTYMGCTCAYMCTCFVALCLQFL